MKRTSSFLTLAVIAPALLALSNHQAVAALLLYEGFNGYANGGLDTITPNANTFGLGVSGTNSDYGNASGANPPSVMSVNSGTGLTMGSLVVSGGAVTANNLLGVASVNITSTTSSSVIWGSYLVNLGVVRPNGSEGFEVRLNTSAVSNSTLPFFRSSPDSRGNASDRPSVGYNLDTTVAGSALTAGTNYLIVSKFDTGVSGGATLWALTETQFGAFVTAGRTEAFLNDPLNGLIKATDAQSGTHAWNTAETPVYLEIATSASNNTRFDEIRYGETLLDVTPIPEPGAGLLLGCLSLLAAARRRRAE